jgi:hypothetical protein
VNTHRPLDGLKLGGLGLNGGRLTLVVELVARSFPAATTSTFGVPGALQFRAASSSLSPA